MLQGTHAITTLCIHSSLTFTKNYTVSAVYFDQYNENISISEISISSVQIENLKLATVVKKILSRRSSNESETVSEYISAKDK